VYCCSHSVFVLQSYLHFKNVRVINFVRVTDKLNKPWLIIYKKKIQFLPYGRSIGSWICLTHKTYTCHTVQNMIRYDIRYKM
jgi:hypothetical protein